MFAVREAVDQSVVAGANGELANVFVYVRSKVAKINPDVEKAALATPVVLDNVKCVFEPHASVLWTKQKLVLKNSDSVVTTRI